MLQPCQYNPLQYGSAAAHNSTVEASLARKACWAVARKDSISHQHSLLMREALLHGMALQGG